MREFAAKTENVSRTLDHPSSASRQMSIPDILQAYANHTLGSGVVPDEYLEKEEKPTPEANKTEDKGLEKEASGAGREVTCQPLADRLPVGGGSQGAIQRQRISSTVTGVTHLVRKKGRSIYKGYQKRALFNGQEIEVETSDKIRSRRGPNQEVFKKYDARNAHEYRWIRVCKVGEEDVSGDELYIRDDTFRGGADIPSGSVPISPSIDHRLRKKRVKGPREFVPMDAPSWYERGLVEQKSSTADRKHAKLLAAAFDCEVDEIGEAMAAHAGDPDMLPVLETIEQHMRHVAPWLPESGWDGKDRHGEGYERKGDYFRTSVEHPLHQAYKRYQQVLGLYEEDVTTQPVNAGWAKNARKIMDVDNMDDVPKEDKTTRARVQIARQPDRIARGPGAVIGNEGMARQVVGLRAAALRTRPSLDSVEVEKEIVVKTGELEKLKEQQAYLGKKLAAVKEQLAAVKEQQAALGEQLAAVKEQQAALGKQQAALRKQQNTIEAERKGVIKQHNSILPQIKTLEEELESLKVRLDFCQVDEGSVSGIKMLSPRITDLRPLTAFEPAPLTPLGGDPFAVRLLKNRRNVHLAHLFGGGTTVGEVTDVGGNEHPNLILEKDEWKVMRDKVRGVDRGVGELHEGWERSGLATSLQVRGSFGHHRPSVSPLDDGRVRINPGLYPMSLLQQGIGAAIGANLSALPVLNHEEDFLHRQALEVAVQHALSIIAADPGAADGREPCKMEKIKEFAKQRLMINLRKAQIILKAPIHNPEDRYGYLKWLENDFVKTALVLENLNESTHLLLTAIVRTDSEASRESGRGHGDRADSTFPSRKARAPLLQSDSFQAYVMSLFSKEGRNVAIYYVESGMQALTTAAMAAVYYRRKIIEKSGDAFEPGKAGFVPLHPYFEMKDRTAAAAGFVASSSSVAGTTSSPSAAPSSRAARTLSLPPETLPPETIIADLSPNDTKATAEEQSQGAVRSALADALATNTDPVPDLALVPVLDATATPLNEVNGMLPSDTPRFIIVESLTKYAQLGSDKDLGGRIIVVGDDNFIGLTGPVISAVEDEADMLVSRIWFESMENMRYSH